MGKTAVFVLATLQQLEPVDGQVKQKENNFKKKFQFIFRYQLLFFVTHVN
jgi:hypothetical protein